MKNSADIHIAILVLAVDTPIYRNLINLGIRKTWGKIKVKNVDVYYYYGNMSKNEIKGDMIYTKSPEGFNNIGYKTIEAFKLISDLGKYDYIFRTNASSYVNQEALYELVTNSPRTGFYSGFIGEYRDMKYAAGSGYSISMDLVKYVIDHKMKWDHDLMDDVALGKILKHIPIVPAVRQNFTNMELVHGIERYYVRSHHYRCKFEDDRLIDILSMYKIHEMMIRENCKNQKSDNLNFYVVHYKKLTHRRKYINDQLSKYGVSYCFIDEYDRDAFNSIDATVKYNKHLWNERTDGLYKDPPPFRNLKPSEICNSLSHLKALKMISEGAAEYGIVLEDDVIMPDDFDKMIKHIICQVPKNFDFIFFGSSYSLSFLDICGKSRSTALNDNVYLKTPGITRTVDAYVVRKNSAANILKEIGEIALPFDFELNYFFRKTNAVIYWYDPGIISQGSQTGAYASSIR